MSLILTRLVDAVANFQQRRGFDSNENRTSQYTMFDTFQRLTPNLVSPNLAQDLKKSIVQPLKIPAMNRDTSALPSAMSCTPSCNDQTSTLTTLTFTPVDFSFCLQPFVNEGNYISYEEEFQKLFEVNADKAMKQIETILYNALDAAKNQVWTGFDSSYTITGTNEVSVIAANEDLAFAATSAFLQSQDFYANNFYEVLGSPNLRTRVDFYAKQGTGNATNTGYQFNEFQFNYNNRITDAVGDRATGFVVAQNSVGVLDWIEPNFRKNYPNAQSKMGGDSLPASDEWLSVEMFGVQWQVFYKRSCQDQTSFGAGSVAPLEMYQFRTYIAPVITYNSSIATQSNPIIKLRYQ